MMGGIPPFFIITYILIIKILVWVLIFFRSSLISLRQWNTRPLITHMAVEESFPYQESHTNKCFVTVLLSICILYQSYKCIRFSYLLVIL